MKIAICPGHHDSNKGAINITHLLNEYDESSKICSILVDYLNNNGYKAELIVGRLNKKVRLINMGKFDLALDIHFNADADHLDPHDYDDSRGTGTMVMYCPKAVKYGNQEPYSDRRRQANEMNSYMASYLSLADLGGRAGWYWGSNPPTKKDYFLRKTNCPALIPEPGYIDNNGFVEKWLLTNKHSQIAKAIFKGIEGIDI